MNEYPALQDFMPLLPELVPREDLTGAIALNSSIVNAARASADGIVSAAPYRPDLELVGCYAWSEDKSGKEGQSIDGYTPEQRFFLGFGRVWCEKQRPEYLRMQVSTNPHSPGKYRVDGVVQNMPEFQKAWGCKAGQPMVAENACHVW